MKRSTLKPLTVALAATFALATGAALAALPSVKTQGDVQYVTGGVGEEEAQSIEAMESKFPLVLEFVEKAKPHDEYVADVDVTVTDRKGRNVLMTRADGPFLLAKLPRGEYRVKATYAGHTLAKRIHVAAHASTPAVFVWNVKG